MNYVLERVTTEFDMQEDRIRLAGQTPDGALLTVWLTRRMLGLMQPVILRTLEGEVTAPAESSADAPLRNSYASLRQEFAQQAARQELQPTAPVVVPKDSTMLLATAVDIATISNGVQLTFRNCDSLAATLVLDGTVLRQWLHLLFRAERAADWQLPNWPSWLSEHGMTPTESGAAIH